MRIAVTQQLSSLNLPIGSLVIQSDVDEIISRNTLELLANCTGFPSTLHLNVDNYRYGFNYPLRDEGYWRPHITIVENPQNVPYHHSRGSDTILKGAGWHCSFCFQTIQEMKAKMLGYSHNDRVRDKSLVDLKVLRKKVCEGRDPFDMWPVSGLNAIFKSVHEISFHYREAYTSCSKCHNAGSILSI